MIRDGFRLAIVSAYSRISGAGLRYDLWKPESRHIRTYAELARSVRSAHCVPAPAIARLPRHRGRRPDVARARRGRRPLLRRRQVARLRRAARVARHDRAGARPPCRMARRHRRRRHVRLELDRRPEPRGAEPAVPPGRPHRVRGRRVPVGGAGLGGCRARRRRSGARADHQRSGARKHPALGARRAYPRARRLADAFQRPARPSTSTAWPMPAARTARC